MAVTTTGSATESPSGRALAFVRGATGPLIGLVLLCVFLSFSTDTFLSMRNFLNVMDQITVLGVMAVGMTLVILIGGIDLSVGSVLALSGMVMGYLGNSREWPFVIAILVALIASAACGLTSGLMVTRLRMPAFIATLAMMSIARGIASIITNGEQIVGFPDWFSNLAITRHFGFLTVTVGLMVAITLIAWIVLSFRPVGRALYALGGSQEVARLAGIPVRQYTIWVYVICGALAGLAGVILSARLELVAAKLRLGLRTGHDCGRRHRRRQLVGRCRKHWRHGRRRPDHRLPAQRPEPPANLALRSAGRHRRRDCGRSGGGHDAQSKGIANRGRNSRARLPGLANGRCRFGEERIEVHSDRSGRS